MLVLLDRGVGALEVEARGDLALAWSIALRTSCRSTSDTTSKVGMRATLSDDGEGRGATLRVLGRCPSGQREQAVNLSAYAYGGSNPSRPT